jgi:poly(3-hydroxybutyrate) depolymerase
MRQALFAIIIGLSLAASVFANTDERIWTLNSGEKLRAAQLRYDSESGEVLFAVNADERRTVQFEDLSEEDRLWLKEWLAVEKEMDLLVQRLGGRFVHEVAEGVYTTDFYIYYPAAFETNKNLPMLILFNASGKASSYVKNFAEAAEEHGIVVVGCASFFNTTDASLEDDMTERFKELLPIIEATVPHDPSRVFMGGNSGGAMRAYSYTAEVDRPWAGIYANAGWLGGYDFYGLPYPSNMRIAMVNGRKDHANRWLERDRKLLTLRGNVTRLFSFDGGHEKATPEKRSEALKWLISGDGAEE